MPKDPYEYFRVEAREILDGLGRGVIRLEKEPGSDLTGSLLRLAHTLKGAARVVKQAEIAEHAHAVEDALAPLRESGAHVSRDAVDQVLKLLDAIAARVAALDGPKGPQPAAAGESKTGSDGAQQHQTEELIRTPRADIGEMDALLDGVSEATVQLRSLRRTAVVAERARQLADGLIDEIALARTGADASPTPEAGMSPRTRSLAEDLRALVTGLERSLAEGVDRTERQMRQVRDAAERMRLLPAATLFPALERTARDVAHSLGKQVAFEAKGGDVRIDAHVLTTIQAALVQLVRNAVAHGIEQARDRGAALKAAVGRVDVEIIRRGNRAVFVCRDDGRGIDIEAVRRAAQARGLLSSSDTSGTDGRDTDGLLRLLLKGGLTTSRNITEVSGRGIGLDIVREAGARLGGEVTVQTRVGVGTTWELTVPVSLSSLDALLVEAGGVSAAIPLDAIRRTVRLAKTDVARTGEGESIVHEGRVIPFIPLAGSLRRKTPRRHDGTWTAVIVDGNTALAAVGVDRLIGTANVVVRSLPALAPADASIAGAAMDAEGTPQLVLDPVGLVATALNLRWSGVSPQEAPAASILVIDDSLTTRMLEQSILESAGYQVDLATSAEEGFVQARLRTYQLFLVDVEMPGMDGFTFVERTRADPTLRNTPAILVTSRNSPEDRQRGTDVGAHAYIVKGEFDQVELLETIKKLVAR